MIIIYIFEIFDPTLIHERYRYFFHRSHILEVHQMELSLYLHRCRMGILFKEKNDPNLKFPLYTIKDHEKGYEYFEETPEYPSSKTFNLKAT